ncbi:MAG: hypothetical protein JSU70_23710 [Phycisphaerales bacterium]|nr:MAG: hypothetical protein JSU70_23710 [Phycisphaerales bacterium]
MKKIVLWTVMAWLIVANPAQADVCEIQNGSFEVDGPIDDIAAQEPNGWTVSVPTGKFNGQTDASWSTDGNFSLFVFSQWFTAFSAGDEATFSQELDLNAVKEIKFDVRLDTYSGLSWDPNICTAVVWVDGEAVWESSIFGSASRGEHLDQVYAVEDKYRDGELHEVSFGLRINVDTEEGFFEFYRVWWDSIECSFYCGGGGLLPGDFDRDCNVDVNDLELLAVTWLAEIEPDDTGNLFHGDDRAGYGMISLFDFAMYAIDWDGDLLDLQAFSEKWLGQVDLDDEHNLYRADDVNSIGIVNFGDFTVLAENWRGSSYKEDQ